MNYNRSNIGIFQNNSSIRTIFHGSNSILLEDELNESQWNQTQNLINFVKSQFTNGILNDYNIVSSFDNMFFLETIDGNPLRFIINGNLLEIGNNKPSNLINGVESSENKLIVRLPDAGNKVRTDYVYLEVWFEIISHTEGLHQFGGVDTPLLENKMWDDRIKIETSRRLQLRWRLSVLPDITSLDNVNAKDYTGNVSKSVVYSKFDNIYIAKFDPQYLEDGSFKQSGETFAVPLFKVTRKVNDFKVNDSEIVDIIPKSTQKSQKYYEEVGESQLNSSGQQTINLSSNFINAVDTSLASYIVTIQGIDGNNYLVSTRNQSNFIVTGTANKKFMYRIIGKKK